MPKYSYQPLASLPRARDYDALRRWGYRIGLKARDALRHGARLRELVQDRRYGTDGLVPYFRIDDKGHAFHAEPHRWLRLTETQFTGTLAYFLEAGGPARITAFLRALDPTIPWPADLSDPKARPEIPTTKGRIDLLVTGRCAGQVWGVVIEAKLGHSLKQNPLWDYKNHAVHEGLVLAGAGTAPRTGSLFVVGLKQDKETIRSLKKQPQWQFTSWRTLLRRFENELRRLPDDEDFRRVRRTMWERVK